MLQRFPQLDKVEGTSLADLKPTMIDFDKVEAVYRDTLISPEGDTLYVVFAALASGVVIPLCESETTELADAVLGLAEFATT